MCGICGFVTKKNITLDQLKIMNDAMTHRGPDDAGEEVYPVSNDAYIGLAHRRLSIVDLSAKGHQPFHSKKNDVIVVFNGEIYNFQELKSELSDYNYVSDCDTEVIIAAYEKWDVDFVKHIDGMFAIALFDFKKNKLYLMRDRMGKKPLYYYFNEGDFVFASVLRPIMEFPGFKREIDKNVIPRFLYNRYIAGEDCILKGVKKVRPGEVLTFDGKGILRSFYWRLTTQYTENSKQQINAFDQAKKQLNDELIKAVRSRMVADVPVGAFLSGGYDSSLVTAIAQSLCDNPIKTFSIGFEEKEFDEAPYAQEIAQYLGTDHTNHYVTEQEMLELVESIPRYYDEPFADSSQIPSMLVAQIARQKVTVALTGDGGDELFCGYEMYDKLALAQKIEPAAKVIRFFTNWNKRLLEKLPFAVKSVLENADNRFVTQFGRRAYEESISRMLGCDISQIPYDESGIPETNWQIRRMLLDSITYIPDNNLCKVDRATMKYSLEARNPLLDIAVVSMAFRIPHRFKYNKKRKKYILKELAHDYIPRELLDRSKKGFIVPIDKWLRGALKEDLLALTNIDYLKKQGIFEPEYTSDYVRRYINEGDKGAFTGNNPSNIVWPLYMFQKWYQYYME